MALLEAGTTLGKYRILDLIGRGGMGVVYLAEDTTLGRPVALKILDRSLTSAPDFADRFRREARTVARLEHPNIVQIHSLETFGEDQAIDMAFVEGGSLADYEARGPSDSPQVMRYTRDVLLALACCHEAGIVHRDVKPSNVLVASDDRALLSDFGLAKLLGAQQTSSILSTSSSSFFLGTPRYAPPESWDDGQPTPAWDVYSMGMVMFEAISGKTPYDAETPLSLMKQMLERPIPRLIDVAEGVSQEMSDLVSDMLERDADKRPEDAGEVLERMRTVPEANAEPTGPPPTVLRRRPRVKRVRRASSGYRSVASWRGWKGAAGLVGLVALVLLVVTGMRWMRGDDTTDTGPGSAPSPRPPATSLSSLPESVDGPGDASEADCRVLDANDPLTGEERVNQWLMMPGETSQEWHAVAFDSRSLWALHATQTSSANWRLEGHWAEYTDDSALVMRHGTVSGAARSIISSDHLAVSLEFRSSQEGSRWQRSLILSPSGEPPEPVEFVHRLTSATHVQALIYNELVPRGLDWAGEVERRFLSLAAPRTVVPEVGATGGAIEVDGALQEAAWRAMHSAGGEALGSLASGEGGPEPYLILRHDHLGLYVGVRLSHIPNNPRLRLTIMNRFSIPVRDSPRWSVQFDDDAVTAHAHVVRGREMPWACEWRQASSGAGPRWETEIFVPFEDLGDGAAPGSEERWRMICALSDTDVAQETPLAWWGGDEQTDSVECGAILIFEEGV